MLREGVGCFQFEDRAAGDRITIRVHYYKPNMEVSDPRIVFGLHGLDRAAAEFRDALVKPAAANGQCVLVPEFDAEAFPGVDAYNYGNVLTLEPNRAVRPPDLWSFAIIDRLFDFVSGSIGASRQTFSMFGNSAGSQFVLRYLALTPGNALERAVASNCGVYMLPDLELIYPAGIGGLGLEFEDLQRYFARPLHILLGGADSDSEALDLPRTEIALAQGPHRLARGMWHYQHCLTLAKTMNLPFKWGLSVIPEAGHVDDMVFRSAMNILAAPT
jgi:pimeloyl-ACP methyl ester carboxylesterase